MLACLNQGSTARFLSYLVGTKDERAFPPYKPERVKKIVPAGDADEGRFAFLVHPLDLQSYHQFDRSLLAFSEAELERLTGKFNDLIKPFVISSTAITSAAGKRAYGEFIAVPRTTEEFVRMPRQQAPSPAKGGVALAKKSADRRPRSLFILQGRALSQDEGIP